MPNTTNISHPSENNTFQNKAQYHTYLYILIIILQRTNVYVTNRIIIDWTYEIRLQVHLFRKYLQVRTNNHLQKWRIEKDNE